MIRRPPRSTRTDTLFPYTTLFRSELCVQVGGTLTGEHGVGMEKINQMCVQFSRDELDAFLAVKRAFDPPGLLNPEKVIPTLARCAESGKMHVHAGAMSFPEIGRASCRERVCAYV